MALEGASREDSSHSHNLAPRPPDLTPESAALQAEQTVTGHSSVGMGRAAKRRRIACRRCRQSKLRCEGSDGGNRACQRCSEDSRPCIIDAEYKRVSKRTTLNDLADHVERLKAAGRRGFEYSPLTVRACTVDTPPSSALHISSPKASVGLPELAPDERQQHPDPWSGGFPGGNAVDEAVSGESPSSSNGPRLAGTATQPVTTASTARTIESTTVQPDQIQHFFDIYFSFYHPSFPILRPAASTADTVYETSPLLFWTIIVTAARHDSPDFSLLPVLMPTVKKLLWSTISSPPHTLSSLQAMAILCVWTAPGPSMPTDITYLLAGILKSAAMHGGLHRPDNLTHYSRARYTLTKAELQEAVTVWCCIYIAVEGVAAGTGQQPFFSNDRTIELASTEANTYNLPESLRRALVAQTFCNKLHSAMSDIDRVEGPAAQSTRSSFLRVLEHELGELRNRLGDSRSLQANIYFLSASFQLRAYWLFDEEGETAARREGVIKAFNTATQLIHEIHRGEMNGSHPVRYLTFIATRVCIAAAIFISKVIHSNYGQYVDKERGKAAFSITISILRQCSVEDNDIEGRGTKFMAQVWRIHMAIFEESPRQPPSLSLVKSRLFFSIGHDSIWLWREKYAKQPSNGAPGLPPPMMKSAATGSQGPCPLSTGDYRPPQASSLAPWTPPSEEPGGNLSTAQGAPGNVFEERDQTTFLPSTKRQQSPRPLGLMDDFISARAETDTDLDPDLNRTQSGSFIAPGQLEPDPNPMPNSGYLAPSDLYSDILFPDSLLSYPSIDWQPRYSS